MALEVAVDERLGGAVMYASDVQTPLPVQACITEQLSQSRSVVFSGVHTYRVGVVYITGGLKRRVERALSVRKLERLEGLPRLAHEETFIVGEARNQPGGRAHSECRAARRRGGGSQFDDRFTS